MIETDSTHQPIVVDDVDADWLLALCEDAEHQSRQAERRRLRYALQWCHLHPAHPSDVTNGDVEPAGGDGTPAVEEFTADPLGAAFGITTHAARQLMADALDLHHRLPLVWARVESLEVPAWRARRIAQATHQLTHDQAATVDAVLAPKAHGCGFTLIDRAIAEATADAAPEEQADTETLDRTNWNVRLFHGPITGPGRWAGTSILEITGDTADLTHLYERLTTEAASIDGPDPIEVRRGTAVGILARRMNGGRPARIKLYVHADLTDLDDDTLGTGSVERLGPLTMARIKDWVGHSRRHRRPGASAWTGPTPSTATTHPSGCANRSSSATSTASSPGAPPTPVLRPRPRHPLRRRRPDLTRESRATLQTPPPRQDPTTMALPTRTRRHLHLDRTTRPQLPRHHHRH